jgi:toxin-antitoxin system PIN domain toxin
MHLLDVNVWVALTFASHIYHPDAKNWINGLLSSDVCYFCRTTQQGFLRLATNPSAFGKQALTLPDAWQKYDLMLGDPRIAYAQEPADLEKHWRVFTQTRTYSPQVWNDAYLAAFALAADLGVVTFDKAFVQYASVLCTNCSTSPSRRPFNASAANPRRR